MSSRADRDLEIQNANESLWYLPRLDDMKCEPDPPEAYKAVVYTQDQTERILTDLYRGARTQALEDAHEIVRTSCNTFHAMKRLRELAAKAPGGE